MNHILTIVTCTEVTTILFAISSEYYHSLFFCLFFFSQCSCDIDILIVWDHVIQESQSGPVE